jgi:hypothetical protein
MVEFKKKPGGRMLQTGDTKTVKEKRKPAGSTSTEVSGGTRSSPPQVGGNGSGEAKGTKARSAASARKTASAAEKNKAVASSSK